MAETHNLTYFFLVFIVFNLITGLYGMDNGNFTTENLTPVGNLQDKLSDDSVLESVLKAVLIPFLLIDFLVVVLGMFAFTFVTVPVISGIFILVFSFLIIIEYILPMTRGN